MIKKITWHQVAFCLILVLSACLNLIKIGQEGYANLYYAAGVKSMSGDLRNFFFNSFDPGGFVSIDKPPLGFWIQVASIKVFGFSGWSLIFPQALAGVLSVAAVYFIVKKTFGRAAGLISSLVLALTPIFVAVSRNNTIDGLLILFLLIGTGFLFKAAEKGSLIWFVTAMVVVGLGFNIKMLQAYMVLPAFFVVYLLSREIPLKKRLIHLAAGIAVLLTVSISWAAIVEVTPAGNRPYVGSSKNNSVFDLIIGYNGLNRIGNFRNILNLKPPQQQPGQQSQQKPPLQPGQAQQPNQQPQQKPPLNAPDDRPMQNQMIPPDNGHVDEAGEPGILRLFNQKVAGQISWLLVLALFSIVFCTLKFVYRQYRDKLKIQSLLLWSTWIIIMFIFFSYRQGAFHRYYLSMMAPAIAAMVGIGVSEMLKCVLDQETPGWLRWMLPVSLLAAAAAEVKILSYSNWIKWMITLLPALIVIIVLILLLSLLFKKLHSKIIVLTSTVVGILALLIAPAAWSMTPVIYGGDAALPITGPELMRSGPNNRSVSKPGANMPNMETGVNVNKLSDFLEKNNNGEKFIAAVPSATKFGSKLVLETGKPLMALGGFAGGDMILTVPQLKDQVDKGNVRFFIVEENTQEPLKRPGIYQWIKDNGKLVPNEEWQEIRNNRPLNMPAGFSLYDMKPSAKR